MTSADRLPLGAAHASSMVPVPLPAGVDLVTYTLGGKTQVGWWDGQPTQVVSPWVGGLPQGVPVRKLVGTPQGWAPRDVRLTAGPESVPLDTRVTAIRFKELVGMSSAEATHVFDPAVWQPVIDRLAQELSPRQQTKMGQLMGTWPAWLTAEQAAMTQARTVATRRGPLNGPQEQARQQLMKGAVLGMAAALTEVFRGSTSRSAL